VFTSLLAGNHLTKSHHDRRSVLVSSCLAMVRLFKEPLTPRNGRSASYHVIKGRAITQAVSRRLPTAARVRAQVRSCGNCGGQSGTWADFLRLLRFLLPILIPPNAPQSTSIIRGWYKRPVSGRCTKWTQSHLTARIMSQYYKFAPALSLIHKFKL
jgi:hypothetical protein